MHEYFNRVSLQFQITPRNRFPRLEIPAEIVRLKRPKARITQISPEFGHIGLPRRFDLLLPLSRKLSPMGNAAGKVPVSPF
jgi:hypothetical protein